MYLARNNNIPLNRNVFLFFFYKRHVNNIVLHKKDRIVTVAFDHRLSLKPGLICERKITAREIHLVIASSLLLVVYKEAEIFRFIDSNRLIIMLVNETISVMN